MSSQEHSGLPQRLTVETMRAWTVITGILVLGALVGSSRPEWAAYGIMLIAALLIARAKPAIAETSHLPIAILIGLSAATLIWSLLYNSMQGSDFGIYFRCGAQLLQPNECQSKYIDLGNVYIDRSRYYTAPIGVLFGENYLALKIYNALLHILSFFLLWLIVRKHLGRQAALLAVLLYGLNPERWYAVTLATPDNLAQLLLISSLGLMPTLLERRWLLRAILLGLCVHIADQLRSVGPFLILTVMIFAFVAPGPMRKGQRLAAVVTTFLTFSLTSAAVSLSNQLPAPDLLWPSITALDVFYPKNSPNFSWAAHLWKAVPADQRLEIGWIKLVFELAQGPICLIQLVLAKASVLFSGSGYSLFASADLSSNLDTIPGTVSTVPALTAPVIGRGATLFAVTLAVQAAVRFIPLPFPLAAMAFFVTFTAYCLSIGETQPRYLLLALPAIAVLGSTMWSSVHSESSTFQPRSTIMPLLRGSAIVGGALFLLCGLAAAIFVLTPYTIALPSQEALRSIGDLKCNTTNSLVAKTPYSRRFAMVPTEQCVTVRLKMPAGTETAHFFVTRDQFLYPRFSSPLPPFRFTVSVDEQPLSIEGSIDKASARFVYLPLMNKDQPTEVTITVLRPEGIVGRIGFEIAYVFGRPN